jgi:GNAT superfamily N-acetyltransferase
MQIRKATASDAQVLFDLRTVSIKALCKDFYPEELLIKWTDGTHPSVGFTEFVAQLMYVVEVGDIIVGCGAINLANGQIDAIFVDPARKNSGIGRRIMQFLEELALESGMQGPLRLEATLNAAPFYRKMGYVGDELSQYHSPRGFSLDCIRMKKALSR